MTGGCPVVLGHRNAVGIEVLNHATSVPATTIDNDVAAVPAMSEDQGRYIHRVGSFGTWLHGQLVVPSVIAAGDHGLIPAAHSYVDAHGDHRHPDWRSWIGP